MIYRNVEVTESGVLLEQVELADKTLITCIPELGPVRWPQHKLIRFKDEPSNDEAATLDLSFNIYLVQTRGMNILLDAGVGNGKARPDRPAWNNLNGLFLTTLAGLGVGVDDVHVVVNTHLHADHVGWNTMVDESGNWVPTFPNAAYIVSLGELEAMTAKAATADEKNLIHGAWLDSVLPIISGPGFRTVSAQDEVYGLEFISLPGHTANMLGVLLRVGDEAVMFSADAIHHPMQFENKVPASNFCIDPELSKKTRKDILQRCEKEKLILAPYHFPTPAFGFVTGTASHFNFSALRTTCHFEN